MVIVIQHVSVEGLGTFASFFENSQWDVQTLDLSKSPGPVKRGENLFPKDFSQLQGLIILGGPMNVYQEKKFLFLQEETSFLKQAIRAEIPVLGICLGAQLMAKVHQAKVIRAKEKEIGWYEVRLTKAAQADLLFNGLDSKLLVFQWHEDTFELPQAAVLLAEGQSCRNQAVRFGKYAWGLQFHLEMNIVMLNSWFEYYSPNLDREKVLTEHFNQQERYLAQAKTICSNFADIIAKQSSALEA